MTNSTDRKSEIQHARNCDERIAAAWDLYWDAMLPVQRKNSEIKSARSMVAYYPAGDRQHVYYAEKIERLTAEVAAIIASAEVFRTAAIALDKELYTGWTRFFLVKHIHSSQSCSSFRPTTRVGWLPSVSGLTEAEAVKEHGATLCTICFPSAPTELTQQAADPTVCAGSGQYLDSSKLTGRENAYYSPTGTCKVCGKATALTSRNSGKIRKHAK